MEAPSGPHVVEIAAAAGRSRAVVNGTAYQVEAEVAPGEASWSLLLARGTDAGSARRSCDVRVWEESRGRLVVHVDGRVVPVTIADRRRPGRGSPRRDASSAPGASAPYRVTAPMPGRVVKLLVARGQAVSARQGLVVVEAMKMENELRAPRAGTVSDVRVAEGSLVEANALLMILE